MKLRSFTDAGLVAAESTLAGLRAGTISKVPPALLTDSSLSVEHDQRIDRAALPPSPNRLELGLWLFQLLTQSNVPRTLLLEPGLWNWLTFFLFDLVCPLNDEGNREWQKDDARYLFNRTNYRKHYRHLLAGPFFLVRTHLDDIGAIRAVLANPPHTPGEIFEQMSARKPLFLSGAAMALSCELYWDGRKSRVRRGAAGSGAGSVRRLAEFLMQIEVTHDLVESTTPYLLSLLPAEFSKWTDA